MTKFEEIERGIVVEKEKIGKMRRWRRKFFQILIPIHALAAVVLAHYMAEREQNCLSLDFISFVFLFAVNDLCAYYVIGGTYEECRNNESRSWRMFMMALLFVSVVGAVFLVTIPAFLIVVVVGALLSIIVGAILDVIDLYLKNGGIS